MNEIKQITKESELIGKTIAKVAEDWGIVVFGFTDGTFAAINRNEDSGGISFATKFDVEEFSFIAVEIGIITQEEREEKLEMEAKQRIADQEARERQQFERLKAKFEKGDK